MLFVRFVLPMIALVCVSWSAFFVRPVALMPRFVSGFISFLGLTTLRNGIIAQMPKTMGEPDVYSFSFSSQKC